MLRSDGGEVCCVMVMRKVMGYVVRSDDGWVRRKEIEGCDGGGCIVCVLVWEGWCVLV